MYISIRLVCVLLTCAGAFINQPIVNASDHRSSMLVKALGFFCGYTAGYMRGIMVYHNNIDQPDSINKTQLLGVSTSLALVLRKQWVPSQGKLLSDGAAGYSAGFLLGALYHMHSNRIVLQKSLKQHSGSIEHLNKTILRLRDENHEQSREIDRLRANNIALTKEYQPKINEITSLKLELTYAKSTFEDLKQDRQHLQEYAAKKQQRMDAAVIRAEEAERRYSDLKDMQQQLRRQIDELEQRHEASERKLIFEQRAKIDLSSQLKASEEKYNNLQSQHRDLVQHMKKIDTEKEQYAQTIKELEWHIQQFQDPTKMPSALPPAYGSEGYPLAPQPYGALGASVLQQNMLFSNLLKSALRNPDDLPKALGAIHQFFCVVGELELLFNFLYEKQEGTIFSEHTIGQCIQRAGVLIKAIESIVASGSCNDDYRQNSLKLELNEEVKSDPTIMVKYYRQVLELDQVGLPKNRFSYQEPLVSYLVVNVADVVLRTQDILTQLLEYEQGIYERVQKGERRINQSDYEGHHKRFYQGCLACSEEITRDCYNAGYEYRICANNHVYQMCAACALSDSANFDIRDWYVNSRCPSCRNTNIQILGRG